MVATVANFAKQVYLMEVDYLKEQDHNRSFSDAWYLIKTARKELTWEIDNQTKKIIDMSNEELEICILEIQWSEGSLTWRKVFELELEMRKMGL